MKICVSGLGLIGGSLCMSLKRACYSVDGYNRSAAPLRYALENSIIDNAVTDFTTYDIVFVALPPHAAVDFMLSRSFKDGAVVSDICGVKEYIEKAILSADVNFRYIGTHPMAGKEVSGIENACADLFDNASMVITRNEKTDGEALSAIKRLVKDMGFKRIVECDAQTHDKKIAYTSQLAHVVSNCYVKDGEISACLGFTGGSFQDMTRIAGVDEKVWAELFFINSDNLLKNAQNLQNALGDFISALKKSKENNDTSLLEKLLGAGAQTYRSGKANSFFGDGIEVTELK